MKNTLMLSALVLVLLALLEVLNAVYDGVFAGTAKEIAEGSRKKERVHVLWWLIRLPFVLAQYGLLVLARTGHIVSLYVHELSHALAQLVFGGRPRVVIGSNGGYAESTPWGGSLPARLVYFVGGTLGGGVMALAPILVASALLVLVLLAATPLDVSGVGTLVQTLAAHPSASTVGGVVRALLHAVHGARWYGWIALAIASLLLAPGMTPSSVDYVHARFHVPAYVLAAATATVVLERGKGAVIGFACATLFLGLAVRVVRSRLPEGAKTFLSAYLFTCGALGVMRLLNVFGRSPVEWMHEAMALLAVSLMFAALVFCVFVVYFLASAALTVRPTALGRALGEVPKELLAVVQPFDTCTQCKMHFRKKCDGCGRTDAEVRAAQARAA